MITPTETHTGTHDDRGDTIRQIAILLHTLPRRTHRVLLGQLGNDDKQRIAREMSAMGEVDAMEQVHVMKRMRDELQTETSRVEKVESEIQDEIQIGRARVSPKRSKSIYRGTDSVADAAADFQRESGHRQTPPTESAAVEVPTAEHARPTDADATTAPAPMPAAMPAAMPPNRETVESMFAQFHQTQAAGVLPSALLQQEARQPHDDGSDQSPVVLPIDQHRDAAARRQGSDEPCVDQALCHPAELAERVDRFLTQLPPQDLCRALGMVSTKQAFLVLCGLPNETAETVLDMLPRRQSRKVRSDMRRMGQLQLSEIDAAKQIVAQIAIGFTPQPTSFAA
ncbi:flagellar motor switch protein G [Stieleria neptunia]|uniref:Flagellar motor switch protein FliG n=1 Tax=Stieleria neptunia TaxID=2527979 RepID=A0A518HWF7_9BACT|nr:FliG C-terminal domain-containing protein [Stieleria neptunia]QDV45190.1 flagellar motor switch protein G [Stieleria neptunia]